MRRKFPSVKRGSWTKTHESTQTGNQRPPEMKRTLEDSLARECPVLVSDIAAQNGYANAGWIRLEFPDLCRAIGPNR
jgi:hypothetical protein